jgi:hypothetical protein
VRRHEGEKVGYHTGQRGGCLSGEENSRSSRVSIRKLFESQNRLPTLNSMARVLWRRTSTVVKAQNTGYQVEQRSA